MYRFFILRLLFIPLVILVAVVATSIDVAWPEEVIHHDARKDVHGEDGGRDDHKNEEPATRSRDVWHNKDLTGDKKPEFHDPSELNAKIESQGHAREEIARHAERSKVFDYTAEQRQSDLWRFEGGRYGGHTLMDHTPRNPANIREEIRANAATRAESTKRVSMYRDVATAEKATWENVDANRAEIEAEAKNLPDGETEFFQYNSHATDIGDVFERKTGEFSSVRSSTVGIIADGHGGWRLYTSYPSKPTDSNGVRR